MSQPTPSGPRRRPVVLVSAFVLPFALAFTAAFLLRADPGPSGDDLRAVSTTAAATTVTSGLELPTTTTVVDTTVPAETTIADTTPVETTEAPTVPTRPVPELSADGAFLSGVGNDDRRLPDPSLDCGIEGTGGAESCDVVAAGSTDLAWVVMPATDGSRVLQVFQRAGAAGEEIWSLVLQSGGGEYRVRAADVTGDGDDDLVVGRRVGDADGTLQVDVVDVVGGAARVSLHRNLVAGAARVTDGQLDLWNGVYASGDAPGSPSTYDHWVVQRSGGAWRVTSPVENDPAGSVPPSQL